MAVLSDPEVNPVGIHFDRAVTFLQKQNVRDDAGACIGKKGVVRKADGTEQFCPFCNVLAYCGVLLVHRPAGGDKSHNTAGAHLV